MEDHRLRTRRVVGDRRTSLMRATIIPGYNDRSNFSSDKKYGGREYNFHSATDIFHVVKISARDTCN